ncbi:hypothetical protein [Streptomyces sp. H27-D2]|uniref:hypothetical protein n=1 Tax=Streptomyces sp. H27-D2 TaxID=3046304 RepID=UPI002DBD9900|nr:hypothetical protein [Streptomyces sp. H27-D2]MEC4020717.1 hypothetical protein [Streptomyces sp. H27-D2]
MTAEGAAGAVEPALEAGAGRTTTEPLPELPFPELPSRDELGSRIAATALSYLSRAGARPARPGRAD